MQQGVGRGGYVLRAPAESEAEPCPRPGHVHHAVPRRGGVDRHLGVEQAGQHQQPRHGQAGPHAGQAAGEAAEHSAPEGVEDEQQERGGGEERAQLQQELVQRARRVRVGELVVAAKRELEYHEAVVHQVDEEEAADDDVGGGDAPGAEADNVDGVAHD